MVRNLVSFEVSVLIRNSITIALITCVNNCGINSRCYKVKIDRYINGLMLVNDIRVSMAKTMCLSAIYKRI